VHRFLEQHDRIFVVEQNRDAQLKSLLSLETDYPRAKMQSTLSYGGLPMDCRCIVDTIAAAQAREEAA
jgi:2-oxoglutarate ferredoxin oxidoreductase subunit alpha